MLFLGYVGEQLPDFGNAVEVHSLLAVKRQNVHFEMRAVLATTAFLDNRWVLIFDPVLVILPDRFRLGLPLIGFPHRGFEKVRFHPGTI